MQTSGFDTQPPIRRAGAASAPYTTDIMKSQTLQVLEMLRKGPITRFHCYDRHILNITARISDLRRQGYEIECVMTTSPLHDNGNTAFGRWYLKEDRV